MTDPLAIVVSLLLFTDPQTEVLLIRLGDDSFTVRETASAELCRRGLHHWRIGLASKSPDPEVAMRARLAAQHLDYAYAEHVARLKAARFEQLRAVLEKHIVYYPYIDSMWYDIDQRRNFLDHFQGDIWRQQRAASKRWALDMLDEGKSVDEIKTLFNGLRKVDEAMLSSHPHMLSINFGQGVVGLAGAGAAAPAEMPREEEP